jgi:drug/metabolite transporter (DMT)-like permease
MKFIVGLSAALYMIAGSYLNLIAKHQSLTKIDGFYFQHPAIQVLFMFIGAIPCLFAVKHLSTKMHSIYIKPIIYIAVLQVVGNILSQFAIYLTAPSICQITSASISIFVALFSMILLNSKINKKRWIAMLIMMIGFYIVGISTSDNLYNTNNTAGIFIILVSQAFIGLAFVIEENFLKATKIDIRLEVGLFGIGSSLLTALLLPLASAFNCSPYCKYGILDDYKIGFSLLFHHKALLISCVSISLGFLLYNISGVYMSQNCSSLLRTMYDNCSTLLIWAISLLLKWEEFSFIELIGFSIVVSGIILNNREQTIDKFQVEKGKISYTEIDITP